ncbi:MAG: ComEC/Rec2 family competence protein [Puniceicoccales bacterium]|jgi:competence protein ComEC|nr:ComEC/Rec2 family competence protein [Puniceicoccales bacterium]
MSNNNTEEEDKTVFLLPPDLEEGITGPGHLPLLWLLIPLVLVFSVCFTFDWHAPRVGLALLLGGGGGALAIAWRRPAWTRPWAACHLTGSAGLAFLLFAAQVPTLPDWSGLPPRETALTVRWEQVFAGRPSAKTITGIARVLEAPPETPGLVGNDIYCQVRLPVPETVRKRGAAFTVSGVLDMTRRQITDDDASGFLRFLERRRATMALTRGRLGKLIAEPAAFSAWCARQSVRIEAVLQRGLEGRPDEAGLYTAILLGKTARISKETRAAFARTGTLHLFSVSGLHVGVIAAALFWLGRRIRAPGAPWRVGVIAVMFVFVMVTGGSPAALRAWLMVACVLAARFVDRRGGAAAGLVLAASAVLLWEPRLLLDISFQLSYGVVAALVFYGLPLAAWLRERWNPWAFRPASGGWRQRVAERALDWLTGSLGIGAASMLAGAPLVVTHFNLFSAGSLLANLGVVPLAFPVMVIGFAVMAPGLAGLDALVAPLNWLAGWNLLLLGALTKLFSNLPGMAWTLEYRAEWIGQVTTLILLGVWLALPFGAAKRHRGLLFLVPPAVVFLSFALGTR